MLPPRRHTLSQSEEERIPGNTGRRVPKARAALSTGPRAAALRAPVSEARPGEHGWTREGWRLGRGSEGGDCSPCQSGSGCSWETFSSLGFRSTGQLLCAYPPTHSYTHNTYPHTHTHIATHPYMCTPPHTLGWAMSVGAAADSPLTSSGAPLPWGLAPQGPRGGVASLPPAG